MGNQIYPVFPNKDMFSSPHFHPFPNSMYPEITSDAQRQEYKREFDTDLRRYKQLCTEMDDISDELNKLSRELDTLDEGTTKYQVRLPG